MGLRRNALFSAAEVVVNGIGLFLIYRHVAAELGVSMVGVWGLVLSTTAFGRAADLGIAGGLSRYVARSIEQQDPRRAVLYMRTGTSFVAVVMAAVVLALWYPLWLALDFALSGEDLAAARGVLPWAILSMWLLMVKSVLDSCLIGVNRADLRSVAGVLGMALQVAASLVLVDRFELNGLAWAQAGQFVVCILLEVAFLGTVAQVGRGFLGVGSWFGRSEFREMMGLGLTLQAGTLATLLFEPIAKSVIGALAGTHVLGIFEIAYRTSYQIKNVATMALQPTIPILTAMNLRGEIQLVEQFRKLCKIASIMAAVLMCGLAVFSPVISWLFLGSVDAGFVIVAALMSITWAPSILAAPSYYLGIATGRVWPYVLGEFAAAAVAPAIIYAMEMTHHVWLIVVGVAAGKTVGSLLPAIYNRPTERVADAAALNPLVIASFGAVLVVAGTTALVAGAQL